MWLRHFLKEKSDLERQNSSRAVEEKDRAKEQSRGNFYSSSHL
jgi:hypothetical protein